MLSLLRGINVAGQKKVPMLELKKLYENLGYKNVRTYIQSGNVMFDCDKKDEGKIAAEIEKAIAKKFGFEVKVLIRTKEELQALIDKNPFHKKEADRLYVSFLEKETDASAAEKIAPFKSGAEDFAIVGREVYLFVPDGYGRTKLSNNLIEKKCGVAATTRNWKTVNALLELV